MSQKTVPFNTQKLPPSDTGNYQNIRVGDSFGRYTILEFLGQGGMGQVFKAYDPTLSRHVALKFIREENPELTQRLMVEARSQARIDHSHICKVYEVGEIGGRVYIALQFIEGQTLCEIYPQLTLEQRIQLMKEVCDAIHAAHRTGLIHRDLKPANILVEKNDDHGYTPYVMDFGLAREIDTRGVTQTGMVMGTIAYMSPEQARGQTRKLDRRTDIYSLGVTLFELLSEQLPFTPDSHLDILLQIANSEPPSLRKMDPTIPKDLETIVNKCLEKDPSRRYESAKSLAEDLGRFLYGEPILARSSGMAYKLYKKALKNKALSLTILLALVGVMAFAGMGINATLKARKQTVLAHRLGQEVKEIEGMMRFTYMLPTHNIEREKSAVRKKIQRMQTQVSRMDKYGQGPGHHAVGRGYLSLDMEEEALKHLEKSWALGYQKPEVAYALGITLGQIYQQKQGKLKQIKNLKRRQRVRQEIERKYRDRALNFLRAGESEFSGSQEYGRSLICFYEKKWGQALNLSRRALKKVPWMFEAKLLEGKIHLAKGHELSNRGKYPQALQEYLKAQETILASIDMARSHISAYETLAELGTHLIDHSFNTGGNVSEKLQKAIRWCEEGEEIEKNNPDLLNFKARAYLEWAKTLITQGKKPHEALKNTIKTAQRSIQANGDQADPHYVVGVAQIYQGIFQTGQGADPRPLYTQGIASLQKATAVDPAFINAYNSMGIAWSQNGLYESNHGIDPRSSFTRAVKNYKRVLENDPDNSNVWNNLGILYRIMGTYEIEHGLDPLPHLKLSIQSYQKVLFINTNDSLTLNNLGFVYATRAKFNRLKGKDPSGDWQTALQSYSKCLKINPTYWLAEFNSALVYLDKAELKREEGKDPSPTLEIAKKHLIKAIDDSHRGESDPFISMGALHLIKLKYQYTNGTFNQAIAYLEKARKINPENYEIYRLWGNLYQQRAQHKPSLNSNWSQARNFYTQSLQLNPNATETLIDFASLILQEPNPTSETLNQGLSALQKVLKANPRQPQAKKMEIQLKDRLKYWN